MDTVSDFEIVGRRTVRRCAQIMCFPSSTYKNRAGQGYVTSTLQGPCHHKDKQATIRPFQSLFLGNECASLLLLRRWQSELEEQAGFLFCESQNAYGTQKAVLVLDAEGRRKLLGVLVVDDCR